MPRVLPPLLTWAWMTLRSDLRRWGPYALALLAVALTVAGRSLDLLTFDVQPTRTTALGYQTGALLAACWVAIPPPALGTWRQLGDGSAALVRAGALGSRGVWWGAWLGRWGLGVGIGSLCVVTTSVFDKLLGVSPPAQGGLATSAGIAVLGTAAASSALTAWTGPLAGALGAVAAFALGQAGLASPWGAVLPMAVTVAPDPGAYVQAALGLVAAVAATEAGHRRATL